MGNILQNIIDLFTRAKTRTTSEPSKYINSFTDDFYLNLVRTINWTEKIISRIENKSQINYATVLRQTNPVYQGEPFYYNFAATPDIGFNYLAVLNDALTVREANSVVIKDINELGQILEFDIDITTHDGAPCAESEGFVDESDIPPMDTWFYLTRTKLYCWIPKIFIDKMQAAIDVEILESYRWVKDSNPSLQLQIIDCIKSTVQKPG
jgi:hypothetical protein